MHPAVRQARRVVGLYGDPDVTWSIVLELDLATAVGATDVTSRAAAIAAAHPHLGPVAPVEVLDDDGELVRRFANRPYGDADPLVRVALRADGRRVLLAAHHGAVDGLGLVGLAGRLLDLDLATSSRGIPRAGDEPGFLGGTARRLGEVAFAPPERFAAGPGHGDGDVLLDESLPRLSAGTDALAWAGLVALRAWNPGPRRGRVPVIAVGVSRRPGRPLPAPDRDTAYTRLRVRAEVTARAQVAALLRESATEPDFPVRDRPGLGTVALRLLRSRLGSSLLVSNLGVVGSGEVTAVRFWPVASGPAGVSLGLASAGETTTLTLRARRAWFEEAGATRLLGVVVEAFGEARAGPGRGPQ